MSNAERALPIGEPEGGAEIITADFGKRQEPAEMEMESLLTGAFLSDENRQYIMKLAKEADVHPFEIIQAAVESYRYLCGLLEAGGKLYVLGRNGQMEPISDGSDPNPGA